MYILAGVWLIVYSFVIARDGIHHTLLPWTGAPGWGLSVPSRCRKASRDPCRAPLSDEGGRKIVGVATIVSRGEGQSLLAALRSSKKSRPWPSPLRTGTSLLRSIEMIGGQTIKENTAHSAYIYGIAATPAMINSDPALRSNPLEPGCRAPRTRHRVQRYPRAWAGQIPG